MEEAAGRRGAADVSRSHALLICLAIGQVLVGRTQFATYTEDCANENDPNWDPSVEIEEGETVYRTILPNHTHRFLYTNYDVMAMMRKGEGRKLIINLEPCFGVAYLFVRKANPCYPDPYSCIDLNETYHDASTCQRTHFVSDISGSRDGAPTFFEISLSTTRYFISVYAPVESLYTLTVLSDIGAFPRPPHPGRVTARQLDSMLVQISWHEAQYRPVGVSDTLMYWIYAAILEPSDPNVTTASHVFLRPTKIMNTVCGLTNTTDHQYDKLPPTMCAGGMCNATIVGILNNQRYMFNVVAESSHGFKKAYGGITMKTEWNELTQAVPASNIQVAGAVSGSVIGMMMMLFFVMVKIYK